MVKLGVGTWLLSGTREKDGELCSCTYTLIPGMAVPVAEKLPITG